MKRLFIVKHKHSDYQSIDFDNKTLAKIQRDVMGEGCYIAKGPDNMGNHGHKHQSIHVKNKRVSRISV